MLHFQKLTLLTIFHEPDLHTHLLFHSLFSLTICLYLTHTFTYTHTHTYIYIHIHIHTHTRTTHTRSLWFYENVMAKQSNIVNLLQKYWQPVGTHFNRMLITVNTYRSFTYGVTVWCYRISICHLPAAIFVKIPTKYFFTIKILIRPMAWYTINTLLTIFW